MSVESKLSTGLAQLGLKRARAAQATLLAYLDLLQKWNRAYNLTAVREPEQMVTQHILDSLSILPHLQETATLVDVGSGAGLPGIPLAIAVPGLAITLVESSHKKAAFLRQAKLELALERVSVVQERVEAWRPAQKFDIVVSRAFAELPEFVRLAGHLCRPGGRVLAMKGLYPHEELASIPPGFDLDSVTEIAVPELSAHRHLVVLKAA